MKPELLKRIAPRRKTMRDIVNHFEAGLTYDMGFRLKRLKAEETALPLHNACCNCVYEWLMDLDGDEYIEKVNTDIAYDGYIRISIFLGKEGSFKTVASLIHDLELHLQGLWFDDAVECSSSDDNTSRDYTFYLKKDDKKSLVRLHVYPGRSKHCKIVQVPTGESTPIFRTVIECDDTQDDGEGNV